MKKQKLVSTTHLTVSKEKVRDLDDLGPERLRLVAAGGNQKMGPCVRSQFR
jgi:hypothetical protein